LQKAYEYVAAVRSADAVVALDLRDVVAAADVRRRIEDSELLFLQIPAAKADELSQVLASIQGVMLGATFGDTTRGKLRVDFGRDASVMKEFAQPLLLKLLEDHGVMIDDFRQWTGKVEGAQFSIEGELSTAGRRRVMSLIDLPASPMMSRAKPAKEERTARVDPKAYSTQRYFQLVDGYLDDLQAARKEARTIAAIGVWLDKYPRKIDRMPMLGVDSEMLDYGRFVSQQLRSASMAIKGIGIASRVRGAEATYGGYRYGRYGWYGDSAYWTAGLADQQSAVTLVRVQERTRGAASALQILAQLEPARRDIREKMMKKYQLEF
jgi:hypothetical protein